ncbi:MAG: family acetyltransferase [Devosia sp.]|nr:family acetyltransferase [Devosia sp.]
MRDIRALTLAELRTLLDWAAAEGWNPGLDDSEPFYAADAGRFVGAFVDGELVAGIAAIAYGSSFGFIGLYICRPDRRGQGHGRAVWDAGMAHLAGRSIGLDGVPEQQANYRAMGFLPAYESVRLSGRPPRSDLDARLVPIMPAIVGLAEYDRTCFPAPRVDFLDAWLQPPRRGYALVEGAMLRGYGTVRPCIDGSKVGPLFANSKADAAVILSALADIVPGTIHIDVPLYQHGLIEALEATGMSRGFSTTRMYRGSAPEFRHSRVFGVTTLELG